MLGRPAPRTIPAPTPTIIPATDLGSVEVAKEGNLYLLTDPRGDIRLDGRGLGLYELDTRILSTSVLRLNGAQLTLLRGPYRDSGADTIQLTNPELRRNPADKRTAASSLGRRELSVTRTRRLEDGVLREEVAIESYSAEIEALDIELGLGVDMADIFEVRGYPRAVRGTLCPVEVHDDRVVFAYDGLDATRRTTTVTLKRAKIEAVEDPDAWPGASVVARWNVTAPARSPADHRLGRRERERAVRRVRGRCGALSQIGSRDTARQRRAREDTSRQALSRARGSWSRMSIRTTSCWIGR